VLQNDLRHLLITLFGSKEQIKAEKSMIPDSNELPEKPLEILVAEDQIINRKIVVQLLEKKGWKVKAVENGLMALDESKNKKYDLILMDVQMPEMDGFDATRAIRVFEIDKDYHTPIVAMTAHAMKGDREKCLAAGMDYYITKPVNPSELYDTIEKFAANLPLE
jgi:CheY-like chemotaxis protein